MKKLFLLLITVLLLTSSYAQDFFNTDFNKKKRYVVLCDPTIHRIQTIEYLVKNKIFDVNQRKIKFVGVYFEDQNYDFSKTKAYIKEQGLENYSLHEIKGDIGVEELFQKNALSEQMKTVFDNSIGIILFGGPDIPPAVYGEENSLSVVTDPQRHYFESSLIFHFLGGFQNESFEPFISSRPDYMVTGFCLGMQTLNVGTGGTLVQDIPAEVYEAFTVEQTLNIGRENLHRNYWQKTVNDDQIMGINLHTINFTNHPFFGQAVNVKKKDTPRILSAHHQAAEKIGKGLAVTALSPDGKVVEGLAHNTYPNVFAVQFHPEVPALYEKMEERKFHPDDEPLSYYEIIGKSSVKFHQKYWAYISKVLSKIR